MTVLKTIIRSVLIGAYCVLSMGLWQPALAAVSLNGSVGTPASFASATSVNYTGITVAAGSDRALVCTIGFEQNATSITFTWDSGGTNQAMTSVNSQKEDTWPRYIYIFGLLAPTTGNKTLAISWTTSASGRVNCVAFDGVLQTNIAAAFTNAANSSGNSANPSQAITTSSGDATVCGLMASNGPSAESQTLIMRTSSGHGSSTYALSTGSSDTHSWTLGSITWGIAGIRINQVAAGGSAVRSLSLMGVGQ